MSGQLSKAKETPSNQPSEIEAMSRTIIANSLCSSNIEVEPIQAPFVFCDDDFILILQGNPNHELEMSLPVALSSNFDNAKPGEIYHYGSFPIIRGSKKVDPFPTQTVRDSTVEGLSIATDSEWDKDGVWLCTTFTTNLNGRFMRHFFVTETLPDKTLTCLQTIAEAVGDKFHIVPEDERCRHFLPAVIMDADPCRQHKTVTLLMFYSAKDLEYSLGWEFMEPLYLKKEHGVTQKRCLTGEFNLRVGKRVVKVKLRDLAGVNAGSLKEWVKGLGVPIKDKGCMDDYKSNMRQGFIDKPELAYAYSRNDSDLLHHAYIKFEELVQWVENDVIKLPKSRVDEGRYVLKQTTGSLIASTFTRFLMSRSKYGILLEFAIQKLGLLDTSHTKHSEHLEIYDTAFAKIRSRNAFFANKEIVNKFRGMRKAFDFTALDQCSVKHFALQLDSSAFNALVQGGRCNNERPSEHRLKYGADIDLSGCYGNALREFDYPIGLPTVWGYQANQPRQTLGLWLKGSENQLVDNLWTVTVTGNLTFIQDLIYSKIVTQKQINEAAHAGCEKEFQDDDRDDDLSHIPGEFALIRKEIQNGIITSEVLKVIKAVATTTELSQFMKLKVVSAAAYLKCDRIENIETWINSILKCSGRSHNIEGKSGNSEDTRTKKWCPIPLEDFIGRLVDVRNKVKKTDTPKSNGLKLFINTLYGDIASLYFPFGNTVLANNITARARVGVWLLNKALHTRQSITDGGIYAPLEVPTLKEGAKLPGFEALADNLRWKDGHGQRRFMALGGLDWMVEFDAIATLPEKAIENDLTKLGNRLDNLATEHVAAFWKPYNLQLPFKIEHKGENTFKAGAYTSKAHYGLRTLRGKNVFKIRGAKDYGVGSELRKSPTYAILTAILDGQDMMPDDLKYDHFHLLKLGLWKRKQISSASAYAAIGDKRPGDAVITEITARYNNTHFPCDTVAEHKRRKDRKTEAGGKLRQWFERYGDLGWSRVQKEAKKEADFKFNDLNPKS